MLNGGSFTHYSQILKDVYMKGVTQLNFVHAASEGFCGINLDPDPEGQDLTTLPTFGFLEFIPENQSQAKEPETLFLEEVSMASC